MSEKASRLVAVSNRLPVKLVRENGNWQVRPGSGGLVTAMAPVLKNRGGVWIGWSGGTEEAALSSLLGQASKMSGYDLRPVSLTAEEVQGYYYGFSNEIIWPLFHDLQTRCNFRPAYWYEYLKVNRKFAEVISRTVRPDDFIWVHDYHLFYCALFLRELGIRNSTGFFLHIPFPPLDIFLKLPWRRQVISALLQYDLLGFQTARDRRHFLDCVQRFFPEMAVIGRGSIVRLDGAGREIRVGVFPISIDYESFERDAASRQVADCAWFLHEKLPDRQVILGIDRLDYTKGIPERFRSFRTALRRYPELCQKVSLVQVVVPSREEVAEYRRLKAEIEQLVGAINGEFTTSGWIPIHYLYKSLNRRDLLAYYRLAEIALITPLKDGMNLVCKEYCACNLEGNGVLILSEFAGAAAQLKKGAVLVNPYDEEGVSDAIFTGFCMDHEERKRRMVKMRDHIRQKDIFWWVNTFLKAAFSRGLAAFQEVDEEFGSSFY